MIAKTVEIFKTNVTNSADAACIISGLKEVFPMLRINFDLDDDDRILRVEGYDPNPAAICAHLQNNGFACELVAE